MEFMPPPKQEQLLPKTLPPRLIVWETSNLFSISHERAVWLPPNHEVIVVPNVLAARYNRDACTIFPLAELMFRS